MKQVRPTLKVIKRLPRDSFTDPSVYDQVAKLKSASKEAREQILSGLRLYNLKQTLLDDARSYFEKGSLPDVHKDSTNAMRDKNGKKGVVYEVRERTGAAWRGGVICDDNGDPWLAHADAHDKFHSSASDAFSDKSRYWPTEIDYKIKKLEDESVKQDENNIACLTGMVEALDQAVRAMPNEHSAVINIPDGASFNISFTVEPGQAAEDVSSAHEEYGDIDVTMEIDVSNQALREQVIRLYLPFLQPDPEMREQVYGKDHSKMFFSIIMSQAQLAKILVTSSTGDAPRPATIPGPTAQHYFDQKKLTRAVVLGEPLRSLCGAWVVPTKEGETAAHLPICEKCESIEPVTQSLLDLARRVNP